MARRAARKAKKPAAPAPAPSSGSLECFTPGQEAALARGWPHLRTLVDGHRDDRSPERAVRRVIDRVDPVAYGVEWPREVACRYVRAQALPRCRFHPPGDTTGAETRAVEAAIATTGPVSVEEGVRLLQGVLRSSEHYAYKVEDAVFLLEAMIGSGLALETLVSGLEKLPAAAWSAPKDTWSAPVMAPSYAAATLGFILLRVPPEVAERERARLKALVEAGVRAAAQAGRRPTELVPVLEILLEPDPALCKDRFGLDVDRYRLLSDPAGVLTILEEHELFPVDPRLVWRLGAGALELISDRTGKVPKHHVPLAASWFGVFRHPATVEIMLGLGTRPGAREQADAWFAEHAAFAKPHLGKLAKGGGPLAAAAKGRLG